jgi:hypothetical protein
VLRYDSSRHQSNDAVMPKEEDRMRTTLTLEPDVAAEVERRRRAGDRGIKEEINRLLRLGLEHDREAAAAREPVRTRTFSVGEVYVTELDDVAGALSRSEGEAFR